MGGASGKCAAERSGAHGRRDESGGKGRMREERSGRAGNVLYICCRGIAGAAYRCRRVDQPSRRMRIVG